MMVEVPVAAKKETMTPLRRRRIRSVRCATRWTGCSTGLPSASASPRGEGCSAPRRVTRSALSAFPLPPST